MSNPANDPTLAPAPRPAASDDVTVTGVRTTTVELPAVPTAPPGYCIERELGRGGMGVVYLAHQIGLNRPVALKMVLTGLQASPSELVRFLAEAEAIAQLHHPNVVQIYEVGSHAGVPYFTLEYCGGGALDAKLAGNALSSDESARLMEGIARGVQAAHARGIIHRDLKPQNVLLSADGAPKVTDFGVAKRLAGGSDLTQTGAVMGTPSYMAPEQAAGKGKSVSPAADVYSLGAILYEMLTGRPPFKAGTPLDTLMLVVSDEPIPPRQLNPRASLDLQTIALKCLHKDPARRYPTAEALADDLARFRTRQPITARPVSAVERGGRWVRRNPLLAAVMIGGPLVLAATTLIVLIALIQTATANVRLAAEQQKAENQKIEAEHQRELAQQRLEKAIEAVDRMMTRVAGERWAGSPELQEERRQVLEEAVAFYKGLAAAESDDPRVQHETARAHARVAAAYQALGDLPKTEAAAKSAVELYERLATAVPDRPEYPAEASESYSLLGNAAVLRSDFQTGLTNYKAAVAHARRAVELRPDDPSLELKVVQASVGECYFYQNSEPAVGRKMAAEVLALARRLGEASDAPFDRRLEFAYALSLNASFDMAARDWVAAGEKYAEADRVLTALADARPPSAALVTRYAATRAVVTIQLGTVAHNRAKTPDDLRHAAARMEEGLGGVNALMRVHPRAFPYVSTKIPTLAALALIYRKLGEGDKADRALAELDALEDDVRQSNPAMFWVGRLSHAYRVRELSERATRKEFARVEADLTRMLDRGRRNRDDGAVYDAACVFAVLSANSPDAEQKEKWAARAVSVLEGLIASGYFRDAARVKHLDKDVDLKSLHGRDDFLAFEARVKNAPSDPPKPK
jgi:tetratricopeptide (TPR) repeat protein